MDVIVSEAVFLELADPIDRYLCREGYSELVATAKAVGPARFYAWYLASQDPHSPVYCHGKERPSELSMFYTGLFWYQVCLLVQDALGEYSCGDQKLFNKMFSN